MIIALPFLTIPCIAPVMLLIIMHACLEHGRDDPYFLSGAALVTLFISAGRERSSMPVRMLIVLLVMTFADLAKAPRGIPDTLEHFRACPWQTILQGGNEGDSSLESMAMFAAGAAAVAAGGLMAARGMPGARLRAAARATRKAAWRQTRRSRMRRAMMS